MVGYLDELPFTLLNHCLSKSSDYFPELPNTFLNSLWNVNEDFFKNLMFFSLIPWKTNLIFSWTIATCIYLYRNSEFLHGLNLKVFVLFWFGPAEIELSRCFLSQMLTRRQKPEWKWKAEGANGRTTKRPNRKTGTI